MPSRRKVIAGAAGWLAAPAFSQVPDWSLRARQRLVGSDPETRARWLDEGERRLAARDAVGAEAAFDRAAAMLHAADTEVALVRTYLQQGQYRRALAFCAHAAGVHRDVVAAAALYVWLLDLGGQPAVARQRLQDAQALYPGEALLAAVARQLAAAAPRAEGVLRQLPARLAPYADEPAEPMQVVGGAVLLTGGDVALVPASLMAGADRAWLRNGLGELVTARSRPVRLPAGLVLLELAKPFAALPDAAPPARDPFGGRPAFVVGQAARHDADSDWPRLRMGFLAGTGHDPARRRLGISLPGADVGAVVLDEGARLAGVALGDDAWVPASAFMAACQPSAAQPEGGRVAPDAAYERGMHMALQVLRP